MTKVKIVKCSDKDRAYVDKIGEELEVQDYSGLDYLYMTSLGFTINKSDCIVIEKTKEEVFGCLVCEYYEPNYSKKSCQVCSKDITRPFFKPKITDEKPKEVKIGISKEDIKGWVIEAIQVEARNVVNQTNLPELINRAIDRNIVQNNYFSNGFKKEITDIIAAELVKRLDIIKI